MITVPQNEITYTGNAWNVRSALDLEAVGFDLIGTSSAAIANSFGFPDGEHVPFDLLLSVVQQIRSRVAIPVSVDVERGYATTLDGLVDNVSRVLETGCSAINLEDVDPVNERELLSPELFANKLAALKSAFGAALFLNARIDTYLQNVEQKVAATLDRISVYTEAGADGVFIPGLTDAREIATIVAATALPVNVMAAPGLPPVPELEALGVKRISFGNFGYEKGYVTHHGVMQDIRRSGQFAQLF